MAAQRVEVVKDGTLKTLLTTRTPSQKGGRSNGHARRTADGGAFHGSATNLFVVGTGGVSRMAATRAFTSRFFGAPSSSTFVASPMMPQLEERMNKAMRTDTTGSARVQPVNFITTPAMRTASEERASPAMWT